LGDLLLVLGHPVWGLGRSVGQAQRKGTHSSGVMFLNSMVESS
jgi:hypothetical protein